MADNDTLDDDLKVPEEEAFGLSRAAIMLDQAKQNRADKVAMTAALNHNLELWVAIRAMIEREESTVPQNVKENLVKLCNFVADTTFKSAETELEDTTIETLININLQISEGLLEGMQKG